MNAATIFFERETVRALLPGPAWWNIRGTKRWTTYVLRGLDGTVVYVGASGDIRQRLLKHIAVGPPAHSVELEFHNSSSIMKRRAKELISLHSPALNIKSGGKHGTWKTVRHELPRIARSPRSADLERS